GFGGGVPEPWLGTVRGGAHAEAQFSPAEGASGDVAKVLLSAARSGLHAVHLVAGDPFGHESVVREVQAVARTAVPFEVVPGIGQAAGVATYAGVPLTGVRAAADVDDPSTVDFAALVSAAAQGSAALSVPAGELAGVRDGLLAAGLDPATPVGITGDGTGETQHTSTSTVDSLVSAALGFAGRVVLTSVNAVRAVWEKFAEHGLDARHFGGVKIACIGEATAAAVRDFGIQPELVPADEQSSEGLLAEFSPHDEVLDPVGRVLLPRADI